MQLGWYEVILLAFALAADAVTVGGVVGLKHNQTIQKIRVSVFFGLFQAIFPLLGIWFGFMLFEYIGNFTNLISCAVLLFIGGKMVFGSGKSEEHKNDVDPTKGLALLVLSVAVSMDAFGVGITLAESAVPIWASCTLIGLVTMCSTALAMSCASWIKLKIGNKAEIVGGIILILIAVRILIQ